MGLTRRADREIHAPEQSTQTWKTLRAEERGNRQTKNTAYECLGCLPFFAVLCTAPLGKATLERESQDRRRNVIRLVSRFVNQLFPATRNTFTILEQHQCFANISLLR